MAGKLGRAVDLDGVFLGTSQSGLLMGKGGRASRLLAILVCEYKHCSHGREPPAPSCTSQGFFQALRKHRGPQAEKP